MANDTNGVPEIDLRARLVGLNTSVTRPVAPASPYWGPAPALATQETVNLPAVTALPNDSTPGRHSSPFAGVSWPEVTELRDLVRAGLSDDFDPDADEDAVRAYGRSLIETEVTAWSGRRISLGRPPASEAQLRTMREAVYASVFALGRLQPLIEDDRIENIEIDGYDNVWITLATGDVIRGEPVADSDADLLDMVQYWAAKQNRSLSPSRPSLHMELPGGARLAATIETCRRPNVVIRRHRIVDVTLENLVDNGTLTQAVASFLRAAVLSGANIVVSGPLDSGKTTLLRAMVSVLPPLTRFATLEKEYELHLDRIGRHPRAVAYQALEGSSEDNGTAQRAGEVTLSDIILDCLRMNYNPIIVGEVRGAEVVAMLDAVSTGGRGSMCTVHANGAADVFDRFTTLCTRTSMSRDAAVELAARALHYVVNIRKDGGVNAYTRPAGGQVRYVSEIVEVNGYNPVERQPILTNVFVPGPDGRAIPRHRPERYAELASAGFDARWMFSEFNGTAATGSAL